MVRGSDISRARFKLARKLRDARKGKTLVDAFSSSRRPADPRLSCGVVWTRANDVYITIQTPRRVVVKKSRGTTTKHRCLHAAAGLSLPCVHPIDRITCLADLSVRRSVRLFRAGLLTRKPNRRERAKLVRK